MLVLGLPAGSAQQKAFLHPVSWVQPLPCHTMHLVGATPLWPPQTHTGLCPLKIQQQKCVRRWELGQLGGEGQWLTGFSWTPSHCILLWARLTVLWTLPHPFYVQFLCCILTLRVITTELHSQFSIATAPQHAVFQLSHLDTASTGMKFTLKQNCVLVRFLVPLKGRSNPDISLPHFNYSQCFLHASNLPWMQQSILRTRIGEQLTSEHIWTEKRNKVWNREKNLQWQLAQSSVVSWYPCIFLFHQLFPWPSFANPIAASSANWQIQSSLSSSSAVQGTCVQLQRLSFCQGHIPTLLTVVCWT